MSHESDDTVRTETHGHVLVMTLSRPAKKNAFNVAMLQALSAAYTRLEDEPELRCGLLVAEGTAFTTGLDLAEVGPHVAKGSPLFPEGAVDPLDLWGRRRTKPIVIAVHGYCLTIGVELLLASDVALAAGDVVFAQMEVQRGIMPFGGATVRFAARCGWGNAMKWMLTGDRFDAAEALRMGLVQEVLLPAELHARARALAERIGAQAPLAVQATRTNARIAFEHGTDAAREALMEAARALFFTADAQEGVRSFLERRAGRFEGR